MEKFTLNRAENVFSHEMTIVGKKLFELVKSISPFSDDNIEKQEILLRESIIKSLQDGFGEYTEEFIQSYNKYEKLLESEINKLQGIDYQKAQIKILILKAIVFLEGDNNEYFEENINDALTCSINERFEDITNEIKTILSDLS